MYANITESDQTPRSVVSDLVLHYFPMPDKMNARHSRCLRLLFYHVNTCYISACLTLGTSAKPDEKSLSSNEFISL